MDLGWQCCLSDLAYVCLVQADGQSRSAARSAAGPAFPILQSLFDADLVLSRDADAAAKRAAAAAAASRKVQIKLASSYWQIPASARGCTHALHSCVLLVRMRPVLLMSSHSSYAGAPGWAEDRDQGAAEDGPRTRWHATAAKGQPTIWCHVQSF